MLWRFLRVRPEDRTATVIGFTTLMALLTAHGMLETARDALFLARLPASELPWAYLAIAAMVVVVTALNQRLQKRFEKRRLFVTTVLVLAAITVGFWFAIGTRNVAALYGFYIWTGMVATVVVVQFWLLLGEIFNVGQAKRLYALIGLGGAVGATAGSAGAGAILAFLPPDFLIPVAAGVMALATLSPFCLTVGDGSQKTRASDLPRGTALRLLRGEVYLRRLLWLVTLTAVTVTIVDYLFKSVVADNLAASELGPFFARYYAGLNGIGVLVQLLVAPWILRRFGVNRALLVMPALLFAASGGFLLVAGLVPAMLLRGVDGALRHSVGRTSTELLYMPLASSVRDRCKGFIDGVGQRGGQALASLLILGGVALGATSTHIVWGVLAAAGLWLVGVAGIKRDYVRMFREQLLEGALEVRREIPELDLHSLEALLAALNSSSDSEVIAALEMFDEHGKVKLVPALILYHPSKAVVLKAIDLFDHEERNDVIPALERLLRHEDPELKSAAIRAHSQRRPNESLLREFLASDNNRVRVTALVNLISHGFIAGDDAAERLQKIISHPDIGPPLALARAIRRSGVSQLKSALIDLSLRRREVEVLTQVAHTMGRSPHPDFLPPLMQMLARRQTREAARNALVGFGAPGLEYLDRALHDTSLARPVRRHLPRTISRFANAAAMEVLVRHLATEPDGTVRFKILRGLGRMRNDNPSLPIDHGVIRQVIDATVVRAVTMLDYRLILEGAMARSERYRTRGAELLCLLLREKESNGIQRLLRLFKLLRPREDFQLIYQGLKSSDAKRRANSAELLENVVTGDLKEVVVALATDAPDAERLARTRSALPVRPFPVNAAVLSATGPDKLFLSELSSMLHDPSDTVPALVAYLIGELGMTELKPELEQVQIGGAEFTDGVMRRAFEMLAEPVMEATGG